ncbi:hypothetical protein [Oleiharenicola lentus]|uniref:hypothetical protein n=1 Tax=Oleiharenicola lentus TaxID=2508720 RepID=UPI003F677B75
MIRYTLIQALNIARRFQALDELSPAARAAELRSIDKEINVLEGELKKLLAIGHLDDARRLVRESVAAAGVAPLDPHAELIVGVMIFDAQTQHLHAITQVMPYLERLLGAQGDNAEPELVTLQHTLARFLNR